ncbi:unnamed protein product, partial [marine sediment metagenome]
NQSICKIVSQGLFNSDPRYIEKIIFMMRHPRAVAKSQEKLKRVFFSDDNGNPVDLSDEFKIQTPLMFINVTTAVSRWLLKYPDIPMLVVHFNDLVQAPEEQFERIREFLGHGDFSKAVERIEPKLNRSKPEDIDNNLWEDAEKVYSLFCAGDYQGVVDYMSDMSREANKESASWYCPRTGMIMSIKQCELCRSRDAVKENFKKTAAAHDIEWWKEPCPYECGLGVNDGDSISIEESVANNHWLEGVEVEATGFISMSSGE